MQDWWRIAPMIFFALISYFVLWLLFIGALLQYISVAAQGEKAEQISSFNRAVRRYLIDIFDYLTYKRDDMPFPFGDFPGTTSEASKAAEPQTHSGPAPTAPAAETVVTPTAPAPAAKPKPRPRAKPADATATPATTTTGVAKRAAAKSTKPKPKRTTAKTPPASTDEG
jgi:hypothetical protein